MLFIYHSDYMLPFVVYMFTLIVSDVIRLAPLKIPKWVDYINILWYNNLEFIKY